jgi:hypothetical protein
MRIGAVIGGVAGGLFAVAVVSFADCSGPHCNRERVLGVLLHLGLGMGIGAAVALLAALGRSGLRRLLGGQSARR